MAATNDIIGIAGGDESISATATVALSEAMPGPRETDQLAKRKPEVFMVFSAIGTGFVILVIVLSIRTDNVSDAWPHDVSSTSRRGTGQGIGLLDRFERPRSFRPRIGAVLRHLSARHGRGSFSSVVGPRVL